MLIATIQTDADVVHVYTDPTLNVIISHWRVITYRITTIVECCHHVVGVYACKQSYSVL